MESIKVRQRIGQDGVLHLDIPIGAVDQDVEAMVILNLFNHQRLSSHL